MCIRDRSHNAVHCPACKYGDVKCKGHRNQRQDKGHDDAPPVLSYIIPVSYTHLDVYKRQDWLRVFNTQHSRSRLPNMRKPTSATDWGEIIPTIMVTAMGNEIRRAQMCIRDSSKPYFFKRSLTTSRNTAEMMTTPIATCCQK